MSSEQCPLPHLVEEYQTLTALPHLTLTALQATSQLTLDVLLKARTNLKTRANLYTEDEHVAQDGGKMVIKFLDKLKGYYITARTHPSVTFVLDNEPKITVVIDRKIAGGTVAALIIALWIASIV